MKTIKLELTYDEAHRLLNCLMWFEGYIKNDIHEIFREFQGNKTDFECAVENTISRCMDIADTTHFGRLIKKEIEKQDENDRTD